MKIRKRQVQYVPGLRNYIKKRKKVTCGFKNIYGVNKNRMIKINNKNTGFFLIGIILMSIGVINIFKNIIVYSPIRFMYQSGGGISFAASSIILFIGIILLVLRKTSILGYILIGIGVLNIIVSIFFSLKMGFLPISLLKSIAVFGCVFIGGALVFRYILIVIRRVIR